MTLALVVLLGEQLMEIVLVIENRFHYTMDVAMALVLTLLFFTSGPVNIAAKRWENWRPRGCGQPDDEDAPEPSWLARLTCNLCHLDKYRHEQLRLERKTQWQQVLEPGACP